MERVENKNYFGPNCGFISLNDKSYVHNNRLTRLPKESVKTIEEVHI